MGVLECDVDTNNVQFCQVGQSQMAGHWHTLERRGSLVVRNAEGKNAALSQVDLHQIYLPSEVFPSTLMAAILCPLGPPAHPLSCAVLFSPSPPSSSSSSPRGGVCCCLVQRTRA